MNDSHVTGECVDPGWRPQLRETVDLQHFRNEGDEAHQANSLPKNPGERMKDSHCRTEAAYKSPIFVAILFKSLLTLFE